MRHASLFVSAIILLACATQSKAGTMGLTSIILSSNGAASTGVSAVITFQPATDIVSTGNGRIIFTFPSNYFTTSPSVTSVASSTGITVAIPSGVASTATSITLTTGGAASGVTQQTITITGMTLGSAVAEQANQFTLTSNADLTPGTTLQPAIVTAPTFSSLTVSSNGIGSSVEVVLVFTPAADVTSGGFITLQMPTGYFTGTASFAAGKASPVASLAGSASAASSTEIVITTSGANTGTAALTVTLTGLTLSTTAIAAASDKIFKLSATGQAGFQQLAAPPIGTKVIALSVSPSSTALATASVSLVIKFTTSTSAGDIAAGGKITFGFPSGWFDTSATPADNVAGSSSVAALTATSVIADKSITITTASAGIPKATAFTITLTGLKTGPSAVSGVFSVSTSADFVGAEVAAPSLGTVAAANNNKSVAVSVRFSSLLLFCLFFVASIL